MGENISNKATDKGLISKICKQLMQLNIKKKILKMGRRSKQTFLQRRHMDSQKVHEKMLNITIREMQVRTTMRYHLTPVRMAIIKNPQTVNAGEHVQERELSYTAGGKVNWYNHYGEQYVVWEFLKVELPYDPTIILLGIYPEKTII